MTEFDIARLSNSYVLTIFPTIRFETNTETTGNGLMLLKDGLINGNRKGKSSHPQMRYSKSKPSFVIDTKLMTRKLNGCLQFHPLRPVRRSLVIVATRVRPQTEYSKNFICYCLEPTSLGTAVFTFS